MNLGEPPITSNLGTPSCKPQNDPPFYGDYWYNYTLDDIVGEDKRHGLQRALGQTSDWFRRALDVDCVRGNLCLSGYSTCGEDGGVQLPHEYVEQDVDLMVEAVRLQDIKGIITTEEVCCYEILQMRMQYQTCPSFEFRAPKFSHRPFAAFMLSEWGYYVGKFRVCGGDLDTNLDRDITFRTDISTICLGCKKLSLG
uniref:Uncharacterized protein n=1 Tax=Lactuca sativa TaxID=4236 RepID=A0A9R1X2J2_LACSA|nr:hypothetical protein LSAT_V11C700367830 [Lactuca sativa]